MENEKENQNQEEVKINANDFKSSNKKDKKIISIICIILALIIIASLVFLYIKKTKYNQNQGNINVEDIKSGKEEEEKNNKEIKVVPTMDDEIAGNSSWAGTFQLVWNDMKNEIVGGDVIYNPQIKIAENLNKEGFTEDDLSEEYYYKKYGFKTLELKEEIKKAIKEKFNQESDILDQFEWDEENLHNENDLDERYFFYTMLYREFSYPTKFSILENGDFGKGNNKSSDVKYFGINEETEGSARNQINVLYYNSEKDFAIKIITETNEEIILCKNPEGKTFNEIYIKLKDKESKYEGENKFAKIDEFKMPNININLLRDYKEFENKEFKTKKGTGEIAKALQTIQFDIDEKGGKIKSEAAIDVMVKMALPMEDEEKPRYFYLDDTFAMFIKEKDEWKEGSLEKIEKKPFFALNVENINEFQKK